jgi:hypothetical protein
VGTQHKQQFVINAYRLINLFMDFLAALNVVRRKPDAQPRVLQAPMQPLAEVIISAAIANETRIELDSLTQERREVLD